MIWQSVIESLELALLDLVHCLSFDIFLDIVAIVCYYMYACNMYMSCELHVLFWDAQLNFYNQEYTEEAPFLMLYPLDLQ